MKFTISQLIEHAWVFLQEQMPVFEKTRELSLTFCIFAEDGGVEVLMPADPNVNNIPAAKTAFAEKVRERVKATGAYALFMISDIWMTVLTNDRDLKLARQVEQLGTAEAERRGLCKRREALTCHIHTPTQQATCSIFYRREGKQIIWEERHSMGPASNAAHTGRLSAFFPVPENVKN